MTRAGRCATGLRGFTLMEVLLALAIGAIVIGAITMAIDFHLRVVDRGRRDVEEAQLARAVLRRIADDLRCAVRYDPLDVNALLAENAAGSAVAGATQAASAAGAGQAASAAQAGVAGQTSDGTTGSSETKGDSQDLAESVVVKTTPGLYGNRYQLQVDVSRLPRVEQYQQLLDAGGSGLPADLVSDVKSVAYYVLDAAAGQSQGLVRRELDRAATAWATQNGAMTVLDQFQELLAPEVLAVEFQYFDGTDYYDEWDSTVNKGLPVAVEIALAIASGQAAAATSAQDLFTLSDGSQGYRLYRLTVHLPASRSAADEAAAASAAASNSSTGSSTGSSTSSSTGSNTGGTP